MGDKQEAMDAFLGRMKKTDPTIAPVLRMIELLRPPYYIPDTDPVEYVLPDEALPLSEEILRLRDVKDLVSKLSGVAGEKLDEAEDKLYDVMATKGPTGFTHLNRRFAMTSTNYVQADKEQGGTGNPELKQWLIDNGMPDVAAGTINANTFKSSVNTWMNDHPIEKTKQVGDDQVILEGAELIEALGITDAPILLLDENGEYQEVLWTAEQHYAERVAQHERLLSMAKITSEPKISVTKV